MSALTGTGTSMTATANVTEHLLWALHVVTDSYDRPGGMWFNPGYLSQLDQRDWPASDGVPEPGPPSRPELPRRFGEWPCVGAGQRDRGGQRHDPVRRGRQPRHRLPRRRPHPRPALASLDTLVVIDVLPTETTELATHVLPAVDQLERADTTWLLDSLPARRGRPVHAGGGAEPVAERKPVWWMVGSLAERLGLSALPRGVTLDTATEAELLIPCSSAAPAGPRCCSAHRRAWWRRARCSAGCTTGCCPRAAGASRPSPLMAQLAEADRGPRRRGGRHDPRAACSCPTGSCGR